MKKKYILLILIIVVLIVTLSSVKMFTNNKKFDKFQFNKIEQILKSKTTDAIEIVNQEIIKKNTIVYDNLTMDQLVDKLNASLSSNLTGTGNIFAKYSLEYGVDPYLAVAISLHETGCKWQCSYLVRACNNVGGQKGSPGCDGGSYKSFNTLEEGIESFIRNIANNYYAYGLTTPEAMQSKYAASTTWASKVNSYIESIKKQ